jgi:hypothetical protein
MVASRVASCYRRVTTFSAEWRCNGTERRLKALEIAVPLYHQPAVGSFEDAPKVR